MPPTATKRETSRSTLEGAITWKARRAAGTAFTPFTYAAAYQRGLTPTSVTLDVPIDNREVMIGGVEGILGEWGAESPNNRYEGAVPTAWAFLSNKIGATVRVGYKTGLTPVLEMAQKAGFESPLRPYPNAFVGSSEVSLAEMTHAYTIFPNLGWRAPQTGIIRKIRSEKGEVLFDRSQQGKISVVDEVTAGQLSHLLAQSLPGTLHHRTGTEFVAGKGGSSYDFTDHWFIGYNQAFTWGVWIGFDQPKTISNKLFSRHTAFPIWSAVAQILDVDEPLPQPEHCETTFICTHACQHCESSKHPKLLTLRPLDSSTSSVAASSDDPRTWRPKTIPAVSSVSDRTSSLAPASPVRPKIPAGLGANDPYGALPSGS
ncbi:MAG: hypothetical protein AAGJ31_06050 [Verrucomicrobiota bacterium]